MSIEEDKHAERYFPKKHPLSVRSHKDIQRNSVCLQPSDLVFEELHNRRCHQSGAKTHLPGEKQNYLMVVPLSVGFIKLCSGLILKV